MKILVTGAGEFLGSHLVDHLIAHNHEVVALDPSGGRGFITNQAKVYRQDYRSVNLEKLFEKEMPYVVCHFAHKETVLTSFEKPLENANHILYSLILLEMCKRFRVKRMIYASSAAAYGHPQYLPCDEGHPTYPISPLGVTHRTVENYLYTYWVNHGLDNVVLRIGNVYGPRQLSGGIIPVFAKRMLKGEQVLINGDGWQERDFVFFSDVMDAVIAAIELPTRENKRAAPTDFIYNLGTGQSVSVNHVFSLLNERIPYKRQPIKGPQLPCEVFEMRLDPTRARTTLGWKPKVSLEQGIDKTLLWIRKQI